MSHVLFGRSVCKDNTITNHNYVCHNILNMIVKHKIEGDLFLDSSLL